MNTAPEACLKPVDWQRAASLKPCPFCGGDALLCREEHHMVKDGEDILVGIHRWVKCGRCGCNTGIVWENEAKVCVKRWNARVAP